MLAAAENMNREVSRPIDYQGRANRCLPAEPTEFPTSVINKTMAVTVATPVARKKDDQLIELVDSGPGRYRVLTNVGNLGLSGDLNGGSGETTSHSLQDLVDDQLGGRSSSTTRVQHHADTSETDYQSAEHDPLRRSHDERRQSMSKRFRKACYCSP